MIALLNWLVEEKQDKLPPLDIKVIYPRQHDKDLDISVSPALRERFGREASSVPQEQFDFATLNSIFQRACSEYVVNGDRDEALKLLAEGRGLAQSSGVEIPRGYDLVIGRISKREELG